MVGLGTLRLYLAAALSVALIAAACSSSTEDGDAGTGSAPAAASDTSGSDEAGAGESALTQTFEMSMEVTSPVFNDIRRIPKEHSCGGKLPEAGTFYQQGYTGTETYPDTSPRLEWSGVPEGARSLALIMDSDQSLAKVTTHWMIWNIPADAAGLPEAVATTTEVLSIGPSTMQGVNDEGTVGYAGPCPAPVTMIYHRFGDKAKPKVTFNYVFHVYALDTELDLGPETTKEDLLKAMEGHIIGGGEITGQFAARTKKMTS